MNSGGDYEALYRRLWALVAEQDGKLEQGARALVEQLKAALAAEGLVVGAAATAALESYWRDVEASLREGLQAAIRQGGEAAAGGEAAGGAIATLQDEQVLSLAEQAFAKRWPDGLNLSSRLWGYRQRGVKGIEDILKEAARTGRSVESIIIEMQIAVENASSLYQITHTAFDDWSRLLGDAATELIKNPKSRGTWEKVVSKVMGRIEGFAEGGTRHAALTAFQKIRAAAEAGELEAVGDAVYWWQYDKQLYYLKRIARTELANAHHNAVIESTVNDPDIIGYQWRLSSSHPAPDICDKYASVDVGLGRGVFPKDRVPRAKAHPQCMCNLVPRVTPIARNGDMDFEALVALVPKHKRAFMWPGLAT
jgi:hypothetical protein